MKLNTSWRRYYQGRSLICRNSQPLLFNRISTKIHSASNKIIDVNALPDCKRRLAEAQTRINENLSTGVIDITALRERVKDMEIESSQSEFWNNAEQAQAILAELNRLKVTISRVDKWTNDCNDVATLIELSGESPEESTSLLSEAVSLLDQLEKNLSEFEVERLLSGKYDKCSCMLCIQSGAGGTDAQDWAGMLLRMYKRYAERKGFKVRCDAHENVI